MSPEQTEFLKPEEGAVPRRAKPFVKWAGGKHQLLPELMRCMPGVFGRYFEPFVGGGALFFACRPPEACLVDDNAELINAYEVIRDDVEALIADLGRHVYEKAYYYELRNADRDPDFSAWSPLQRASRLIYLNKTCFNGLYRVNKSGHFNVPFGRYTNPTIVDPGNLRACHLALRNTELVCGSFLEVESRAAEGDFVYFDPPYAPLSKTANFTHYDADGFSESDHHDLRDLCERLDARGVKVMVSNSLTEFTEDLYKEMKLEVVYAARSINAKGNRRGKIAELVATNY